MNTTSPTGRTQAWLMILSLAALPLLPVRSANSQASPPAQTYRTRPGAAADPARQRGKRQKASTANAGSSAAHLQRQGELESDPTVSMDPMKRDGPLPSAPDMTVLGIQLNAPLALYECSPRGDTPCLGKFTDRGQAADLQAAFSDLAGMWQQAVPQQAAPAGVEKKLVQVQSSLKPSWMAYASVRIVVAGDLVVGAEIGPLSNGHFEAIERVMRQKYPRARRTDWTTDCVNRYGARTPMRGATWEMKGLRVVFDPFGFSTICDVLNANAGTASLTFSTDALVHAANKQEEDRLGAEPRL